MSILNGSFEEGPDQWWPVWARARRRAARSHEVSVSVGWLGFGCEPQPPDASRSQAHLTTCIATSGGNDRLAAAVVHPPSTMAIGVRFS